MKFGLSNRKHMPVLKVGDTAYPLWQFKRIKRIERLSSCLSLDQYARDNLFEEWDLWEEFYIPPFPLMGKTVLDVGACCGETAYFFLKNGARKVICIESDRERAAIILENKQKLDLNLEIINETFRPEHIQCKHDFMKCDVEGAEVALLPITEDLQPTIVEVHSYELRKQFEEKEFKVVFEQKNTFLMTNFSRKEPVFFSVVEHAITDLDGGRNY